MTKKIIELINEKAAAEEVFYSFEYFPPKTDEGTINLFERQAYMKTLDPLFCDITWGAGGSTSELTLSIATHMQQKVRGRRHLTRPRDLRRATQRPSHSSTT